MSLSNNQIKVGSHVFTKFEHKALDGSSSVSFVQSSENINAFTIRASRLGLQFKGDMHGALVSMKDLEGFAKLVSLAWTEKSKLDPVIVKPGLDKLPPPPTGAPGEKDDLLPGQARPDVSV